MTKIGADSFNSYDVVPDITIQGYKDSVAHKYAMENDIEFEFVPEDVLVGDLDTELTIGSGPLSLSIPKNQSLSGTLKLGEDQELSFGSDNNINFQVFDSRGVEDNYNLKVYLSEFTHEDKVSNMGIGEKVIHNESYDPTKDNNFKLEKQFNIEPIKLDTGKFIKAGKYKSKLIIEVSNTANT